jgi:DNA-binding transcriptional LysR family regulator
VTVDQRCGKLSRLRRQPNGQSFGSSSIFDADMMKNIDSISLRQLRCFVTVAEELHFRRAAERLNMSQPPLTRSIQTLEQCLGVELFVRKGRAMELTEGGRLVLSEARAALAQVDRVRDAAHKAESGEAGTVRIAAVVSVSFLPVFTAARKAFARDYPGAALEFTWSGSSDAIQALRKRKVDLALIRHVSQHLDDLAQITLASDRLMLVLPADHPKARAEKVALSDLVEDHFILFPPEKRIALYGHIMDMWARTGLTPRISQEANNGLTILALVAAGFGNAILPSTLAGLHMPHVVWKHIDIDARWTESSIVILHRPDVKQEKLVLRFLSYLQRHASDLRGDAGEPEPWSVLPAAE